MNIYIYWLKWFETLDRLDYNPDSQNWIEIAFFKFLMLKKGLQNLHSFTWTVEIPLSSQTVWFSDHNSISTWPWWKSWRLRYSCWLKFLHETLNFPLHRLIHSPLLGHSGRQLFEFSDYINMGLVRESVSVIAKRRPCWLARAARLAKCASHTVSEPVNTTQHNRLTNTRGTQKRSIMTRKCVRHKLRQKNFSIFLTCKAKVEHFGAKKSIMHFSTAIRRPGEGKGINTLMCCLFLKSHTCMFHSILTHPLDFVTLKYVT